MLLADCENPTYNNHNVAVQSLSAGGPADNSKQVRGMRHLAPFCGSVAKRRVALEGATHGRVLTLDFDVSPQIQPGDVLLKIDGRDLVGLRKSDLGDLLLGPVGSAASLTLK